MNPTIDGSLFTDAFGRTGHIFEPGYAGLSTPTNQELTISVDNATAPPGSVVHFLVTLAIAGQPISGAPVTLTLLSAPDADARLTPSQGTTDSNGQVKGAVQLSRKAGDHLFLARSGIYVDEGHIVGRTPATTTGGLDLPFGLGPFNITVTGNPLVIWLSIAAVILVALGVVVNVDQVRRFLWSMSGRRLIARLRPPRSV